MLIVARRVLQNWLFIESAIEETGLDCEETKSEEAQCWLTVINRPGPDMCHHLHSLGTMTTTKKTTKKCTDNHKQSLAKTTRQTTTRTKIYK